MNIWGNANSKPIVICQANYTHWYKEITEMVRDVYYTDTCKDECTGKVTHTNGVYQEVYDYKTKMKGDRIKWAQTQIKSYVPYHDCMKWVKGLK